MQRTPKKLSFARFDLVVIGGGINGAATARKAAMRGLKVALVEGSMFAGHFRGNAERVLGASGSL